MALSTLKCLRLLLSGLSVDDEYMEPTTNTSQMVAHALSLELLDEEGTSRLVPAEMRYDLSDPCAVTLSLRDGDEAPITWIFARELLSEGLHGPCGDGDVHVWPWLSVQGRAVLLVALSSNDGTALLQAQREEVESFVSLTYEQVAAGEESAYIDIDAVVAEIFAAEPTQG